MEVDDDMMYLDSVWDPVEDTLKSSLTSSSHEQSSSSIDSVQQMKLKQNRPNKIQQTLVLKKKMRRLRRQQAITENLLIILC